MNKPGWLQESIGNRVSARGPGRMSAGCTHHEAADALPGTISMHDDRGVNKRILPTNPSYLLVSCGWLAAQLLPSLSSSRAILCLAPGASFEWAATDADSLRSMILRRKQAGRCKGGGSSTRYNTRDRIGLVVMVY